MKTMKNTKKVIAESSFNRGWSQVPYCFREEARNKLMKVFCITTMSQFYARLRGEVEPKKSQIAAIEEVFGSYGIKEVWGFETYTNDGCSRKEDHNPYPEE